MCKQKNGFIDGPIKRYARESTKFDDWVTMDLLRVSWIFVTIDLTLIPQLPYKSEAKAL